MDELRTEMFQVAVGYWLSKALFCAAKANVADQLEGGPRAVDELASAAGVDSENLYRVLRALASIGIFEETEPGIMALSPPALEQGAGRRRESADRRKADPTR